MTNDSVPIGYLIAADRYFKRDEVGYVTQVNVVPEYRRHLVAARLLQAQFDRSASGCKLYCCWCAQDLKANAFWESMGFVPIAFRSGSAKGFAISDLRFSIEAGAANGSPAQPQSQIGNRKSKIPSSRLHIFWQKRIRPGDEQTPWWYPSHTGAGELRADRLVFPIMPGVGWRDVRPVEVGAMPNAECEMHNGAEGMVNAECQMPNAGGGASNEIVVARSAGGGAIVKASAAVPAIVPQKRRAPQVLHVGVPQQGRGLWFGPKPSPAAPLAEQPKETAVKRPKVKARIDPRLKAIARELRDQWSERSALIVGPSEGKYDVRRAIDGPGRAMLADRPMKQLGQAA